MPSRKPGNQVRRAEVSGERLVKPRAGIGRIAIGPATDAMAGARGGRGWAGRDGLGNDCLGGGLPKKAIASNQEIFITLLA
jgi:hypothetical protein